MLFEQVIANNPSLQPYEYVSTEIAEDGKRWFLHLKSSRGTEDVTCPFCNSPVHICGNYSMKLRDMPIYPGTRQDIEIAYHRYRCQSCARTFREEIPFRHPETRITERAATWISAFLRFNIPISTVQRITGVHWDTIKSIHKELMDEAEGTQERGIQAEASCGG